MFLPVMLESDTKQKWVGLRVCCRFLITCVEERSAVSMICNKASFKMPLCLVFGVFVLIIFVWAYIGGHILWSY